MAVAWRLVQMVALITYCVGCWGGQTGATSRLGYREFCKADRGDWLAWCLMDFETLKFCFDLIVRATEAVDRSDFSNVDLWPNWVYRYRKSVTCWLGE